ncbi:PilT/PilU family type 4a pilus ATPase [Patescibacteria group bacterium]|nr:PilT/PilU family type 4a pilus ATPase [Patescibacteria group bacterium]MCL5091858.1 PilT/PilU family type 4a pilus ATPase [Patescibacteria group bacterium]
MDIKELLQYVIDKDASDLHIIPGYQPTIRINNELFPLRNYPVISEEMAEALTEPIISREQKELLLANRELDMGYNFGSTRFRINIYFTRNGISLSLRTIPEKIRTIEELLLPNLLHQFAQYRQGLVLLTGPTGEGKSTTLAAIINEINQSSGKHIITVEDPIEFIFPKALSIVSQRQLHEDTHSWSASLRSAMREDPDVILIGEMRDYDTIQAAITLAETGHLVFSTLHTNSAPETIDRIIDVFPSHQQNQVRNQVASTLKAIVAQRLLPTIDNRGRIVATEILLNIPAIASVIREGKTYLIDNIILTNENTGMIYFEKYLIQLYQQGKISRETAASYAIRPGFIKKLL